MPRFHVQRSLDIQAAPDKVFQVVTDYRSWSNWSPWLCAEPDAQVTITDNPSSVGSVYAWKGDLIGEGEIEHRHLEPGHLIEDEIRFVKPFRNRSRVVFDFAPSEQGTTVTWYMDGSLPWFLFWMRSQMQSFIGMDYERGLRMLKEWIETGQVLSKVNIRGVEPVGPLRMVGVRKTCRVDDVGPSMQSAFDEATERLAGQNLPDQCEAISVYHQLDLKNNTFDYTSGYVFPESAEHVPEGLSTWSTSQSNALCVEHTGSYENLGNAWSAAHQYVRYKKLKMSGQAGYEIYRNDPHDTPAAQLRTEVFLPLRS